MSLHPHNQWWVCGEWTRRVYSCPLLWWWLCFIWYQQHNYQHLGWWLWVLVHTLLLVHTCKGTAGCTLYLLNSWMKCFSSLKCHELYVDTWHIQVSKFPLAGVTVDLQETDIMVNEDVGSVQVCVVVKCGCVRRDVEVNLNVLDDTGQCKLK